MAQADEIGWLVFRLTGGVGRVARIKGLVDCVGDEIGNSVNIRMGRCIIGLSYTMC